MTPASRPCRLTPIGAAACAIAVAAGDGVPGAVRRGFAGDSFLTLSATAATGLAALAVAASLAVLALSLVKSRWLHARLGPRLGGPCAALLLVVPDALASLAGFALASTLAPQLFYTYYLVLFPGLPWQCVVGDPPTAVELVRLLALPADVSLAELLAGVLLRAMLVGGVLLAAGSAIREWRARATAPPR